MLQVGYFHGSTSCILLLNHVAVIEIIVSWPLACFNFHHSSLEPCIPRKGFCSGHVAQIMCCKWAAFMVLPSSILLFDNVTPNSCRLLIALMVLSYNIPLFIPRRYISCKLDTFVVQLSAFHSQPV